MLSRFETSVLQGDEVHALAAALPGDHRKRLAVIQAYYEACHVLDIHVQPCESNLLQWQEMEMLEFSPSLVARQHRQLFRRVKEIYVTYRHFVKDFISWGAKFCRSFLSNQEREDVLERPRCYGMAAKPR
jgi:fatty acid synthase subunit beta